MALGAVVLALAAHAGPMPHGTLKLTGTFRDGSTITAQGLSWHASPGSLQSVSYSWSACTRSRCARLSTPPQQPYLAGVTLGPGDVGKRIRVRESATDVLPGGRERHASRTYESHRAVAPWPAGRPPRVDFVYGLPEQQTASTREQFDLSLPHANPGDGKVTVSCSLDGTAYSRCSRSYLTPSLGLGTHVLTVRARNRAGARTTSYSWKVVPLPAPVACGSCFEPPHLDAGGHPMSWDWQLQGKLVFRRVDMLDVDGFDTPQQTVAKIHARAGRTLSHERAICYLSLGSWERYRPDEASWPSRALGLGLGGYPDEHWVDVRQLQALWPLIVAREQMCAAKGFDGVEVDNIDGWDNHSGFPLTPEDAQAWLAQVANEAHALHMFVLWKNDPYLASFGERYFDGALSEQCYQYEECTARQNAGIRFFKGLRCDTATLPCGVAQFAAVGKWVGEVEYKWGVPHEDGAVCDPRQHCALRSRRGSHTEVPYKAFCDAVYRGLGFSAWRAYESDSINGRHAFYCWRH
jgi:hypothetical protein